MAIRNDVTIDWTQSPRVIIVQAPSIEITMQDTLDTLRFLESQPTAMDNPPIVSASGKEVLDTTTKVGLTVSLLNAQIGFEARLDWTSCALKGGNLVAFDTDGVTTISPIYPTAFVNIERTSSSSGTLQEQDALQYASYQNSVWIDVTTTSVGVDFPSGTREYPVNNVQDAVSIANLKGFSVLRILGNLTMDATAHVDNFTIIGQNPSRTLLNILPDAFVNNCEIKELYLMGMLDGNTTIRECIIGQVDYISGYVHHSVLTQAVITLGNNSQALFLHCYSGVAGDTSPTIDMGGSGQSLGLRNYNGGVKIINRTGIDPISIDMNSGQVTLDETCTAGDFHVRGVYKVTDNSTGTAVLRREGKANTEQDDIPTQTVDLSMARYQNKAVYLDPELAQNGDGSATNPFNNVQDTKDFAEANGILTVYIYSDVTILSNVKNFTVIGIGNPVVNCNGQDLKNTEFVGCELRGTYTDSIKANKCVLGVGFHLNGGFKDCSIMSTLTCIDGGNVTLFNCFSNIANYGVTELSLNGLGSSKISIVGFKSDLIVSDVNNVNDLVKINMDSGKLTLDATCTDGLIEIAGQPYLTNEANGSIVDVLAMADVEVSAKAVWDYTL